ARSLQRPTSLILFPPLIRGSSGGVSKKAFRACCRLSGCVRQLIKNFIIESSESCSTARARMNIQPSPCNHTSRGQVFRPRATAEGWVNITGHFICTKIVRRPIMATKHCCPTDDVWSAPESGTVRDDTTGNQQA